MGKTCADEHPVWCVLARVDGRAERVELGELAALVVRQQQADFAKALKDGGNRDVDVQMIRGRTHNTVWTEMGKGEEDTSRAILQFVNRLARVTSR